jgi:hypothetical protein
MNALTHSHTYAPMLSHTNTHIPTLTEDKHRLITARAQEAKKRICMHPRSTYISSSHRRTTGAQNHPLFQASVRSCSCSRQSVATKKKHFPTILAGQPASHYHCGRAIRSEQACIHGRTSIPSSHRRSKSPTFHRQRSRCSCSRQSAATPPPQKKTRAKIAKDASERWKRRKRKCMDAHGMDGRTDI